MGARISAPLDSRFRAGLSGEIVSPTITGFWLTAINLSSSCADLIRASTSLFRALEGVDGRVKPGQDEIIGSIFRPPSARFYPDSPAF